MGEIEKIEWKFNIQIKNYIMKIILKIMTVVAIIGCLFTSCQKEYTITAMPDYADHGTVIGGGVYKKGTIIQLSVVPATGYLFDKWDDGNTENPRSITVQSDAMYIATFTSGGENPTDMDVFSVSATKKVYFSPGNLQYIGSSRTPYWKFAEHQWDTLGKSTGQNTNITNVDRDLFGWGTSGWDNGNTYYKPWSTNYANPNDNQSYGYGPVNGTNYELNLTGSNADWGVYNAIYNPQTQTTDAPGTWRTLTNDEWKYLLEKRSTTSSIRYAKAKVNRVSGLIIVPDNWNQTIYPLGSVNSPEENYSSNYINETDWEKMETAGCVFLPAAGGRNGTALYDVGSYGRYWSATCYNSSSAHFLFFDSSGLNPSRDNYRYVGQSVRLVKDVK